jgi:hypothetical protein
MSAHAAGQEELAMKMANFRDPIRFAAALATTFLVTHAAVAAPAVGVAGGSSGAATTAAAGQPDAAQLEAGKQALARAHAAVVGLEATAVEDARSIATLGKSRQGSGVLIGDDGPDPDHRLPDPRGRARRRDPERQPARAGPRRGVRPRDRASAWSRRSRPCR